MAWRFSTRASVATALSVHSTHAFPAVYGLTQRPGQNGCHFADNICECIFFHENVCCCISIKKSLKFVLEGPINNIPALASLMACRCPDNKPLSEPMVVSLLLHICVTRPEWVKRLHAMITVIFAGFLTVFDWWTQSVALDSIPRAADWFHVSKSSHSSEVQQESTPVQGSCHQGLVLTHCILVMPYGNMNIDQHWLR